MSSNDFGEIVKDIGLEKYQMSINKIMMTMTLIKIKASKQNCTSSLGGRRLV